ncbi:GNAT family N-acetyltransferase (plasmid) [Paenibacillus rhizovicinus]|uniref:GNAT family N-acetyltransferase n=1 Tax=Paenibacillus rhizovicinus TaxID=2704463 RepID=A0A6C0PCY4_9BACL|nr:GNAT family N-acetyltransferase [Paenibacillus rhizovicinus]QHW35712.1 GNAT family N-acetyltransferase [Paenibacillus rhizovicinus]
MSKLPRRWYDPLAHKLSDLYGAQVFDQPGLGNGIFLVNDSLDLYIRVLPEYGMTIARIDVGEGHTRNGIGSAIVEWCKEFCLQHRIPELKMECVLTEECAAFCRKQGFSLARPSDDLCFDWVLPIPIPEVTV